MKKKTEDMSKQGSAPQQSSVPRAAALPPIKFVKPAASPTIQTPSTTSRKEAADKPQDGIPFLYLPILPMYTSGLTANGLPTFNPVATATPLADASQTKSIIGKDVATPSASTTKPLPFIKPLNLKSVEEVFVLEEQPASRKKPSKK